MKLSIFVTITNPLERQDPFFEAIENYLDFADEVVIVDGTKGGLFTPDYLKLISRTDKLRFVEYEWPDEFDWKFIGEQFQRGYDACTGDWVIRADLDYFFHEDDLEEIRQFLVDCDAPSATMPKRQFLLADRSRVKSRVAVAFNKGKYGNRIKLNSGGDLCQPSLDGKELDVDELPEISKREYVFVSQEVTSKQLRERLPNAQTKDGHTFVQVRGITFWNYDFCFKEKETIHKDFGRFARAWNRTFGDWKLGGQGNTIEESNQSAFDNFVHMMVGRYKGSSWQITSLGDHPKYIVNKVKNIKPEQFGCNMWGSV